MNGQEIRKEIVRRGYLRHGTAWWVKGDVRLFFWELSADYRDADRRDPVKFVDELERQERS